jgi:hypothetical protein
LRLTDLWPHKPAPDWKTSGKKSWKTTHAALKAVAHHIEPKPVKVQDWTYTDAHGNAVMVVGRFDSADGMKTYRPFHRLPDGTWAVGDSDGLLPLYRLPEIIEANEMIVCEGEKCADAVREVGWPATTSAHGSGSPEKSDWSTLAGRDVVVLPDADTPGEGYGASVLRILKRQDPRPRVKLVRLPGLSDGEDVADWIPRVVGERTGNSALEAVRAELRALVQSATTVDWDAVEDARSEVTGPAAEIRDDSVSLPIRAWPAPPDEAAFHGIPAEVVGLIDPASEADPVGVLLQFVVGFGNAVGRNLSIVADGQDHFANEFVVLVGDTSRARKGTAWRRVRSILSHVDADWADNRITGGLSSGEGLVFEVRDPLLGTDKKSGREIIVDPGVEDKRVLIVESELGNALRVLAREGNTLSGVLRLAWDGDTLRTMVKNNPARATNPHVSLIGHVTAEELTRYLSHVEIFNGLGNRILWACVRRSKRLPFGGTIDGGSIMRLESRLVSALDHARRIGQMKWSSSGAMLWESHYNALTDGRPGLWGAITARSEAHVLRLAMIYAALDCAHEIADTHLLAALALWEYCDRSAAYLFGGSLGDRVADSILAVLRAKPEGMTRSEIGRVIFHNHRSSEDVARALELLERHGLVRKQITPTAGRDAERWYATDSGRTLA